ncbi:hypothetical protein E2C01_085300 [Portunus trituberculatus]|uniref:Uncharacterized protein n=1 Tax=Portunus trituberculatus TaxID=210409 RepID=A0A5B7J786_PORTR|nr:hypothetical protein [Portunus trituberculatus]
MAFSWMSGQQVAVRGSLTHIPHRGCGAKSTTETERQSDSQTAKHTDHSNTSYTTQHNTSIPVGNFILHSIVCGALRYDVTASCRGENRG